MKYAQVQYDWKDGGNEAEWISAITEMGLCVTENPLFEGSDQHGYIITKKPLTDEQLKEFNQ